MIMNELNNDVVFYMSVMMVVLTVAVGIVFGVAKAKIKPQFLKRPKQFSLYICIG